MAPLLGGVHAGDADRLSITVGAAPLAAAGREAGSLIEALRTQRAAALAAAAARRSRSSTGSRAARRR